MDAIPQYHIQHMTLYLYNLSHNPVASSYDLYAFGFSSCPYVRTAFWFHQPCVQWRYTHERAILKIPSASSTLTSWKPSMLELRDMVETLGTVHVQSCVFQPSNNALLCTFVERWQLDKNNFHMPFSEMMITLHDVDLILGIPVCGTLVNTVHTHGQLRSIVNNDFDVRYIGMGNDFFLRGGIR